MIIYNTELAYKIADEKGIPIAGTNFVELDSKLKPGEVVVALYFFLGELDNFEGARIISSGYDLSDYMARSDYRRMGFFAVNIADLSSAGCFH